MGRVRPMAHRKRITTNSGATARTAPAPHPSAFLLALSLATEE